MSSSPYYPAGVTDEMIAELFDDDGACCERCYYYYCGMCSKKEHELDNLPDEEYDAMTDEEKDAYSNVEPDDYCDNFEWEEEDNPFEDD